MPEPPQTSAALAEAIRQVAIQAHTEEDLKIGIEKLLDPFIERIRGVRRSPSQYEHATSLGGIADALHGNVIIEYERPGKLAKRAGFAEAEAQLQRYLLEEGGKHGRQATEALRRMVGVGLDGKEIFFVRYRGRRAAITARKTKAQLTFFPEAETGDFSLDGPHPVSAESIDHFLSFLESLGRLQLRPDLLTDTFGPERETAQNVVGLLYQKLVKTTNRRVQTFFAEWQRIFGIVYGQEIGKAASDARALGKQFGMKDPKLKEFLFAVHTYFALLMKLLVAELMTLQRGSMLESFLHPLASKSADEFRSHLKDLEDGGLFSRQGINNFLEGDFFSWYLSEWDKDVFRELRGMVKELGNFDPRTPYLAPEQSRDLLKKLYQYLVPKKLRHDLGEYYTPDWLAEHLLNQLEYDGNLDKRLLDPACGSGTFLVLAINRMKQWADDHDPPIDKRIAARKILDNLCGFDLNPIAVIAARTNFLLALGELLREVRPIEIPVYMCDSVLTPSKYADIYGEVYGIPTVVGKFEIPAEIVASRQMDKLVGLLEQCVHGEYSPREFLNRARRELTISQQETPDALLGLYQSIGKLGKENPPRNGLWARWLKNAFAPLFKGHFDFVAGNPPWINWESLSDEYREATRKLWDKYGLFSLKGHAARLGGGKKDFSMLFAYASADSYLKDRGKLGFVITQTVFKTKGAGDGFRRFLLGTGAPVRVIAANDMVDLKPFEGATNRTATFVFEKGKPTEYPVVYWLWQRRGGSIPYDAPLEEVQQLTRCVRLVAQPVEAAKLSSPWMTAPAGAVIAGQKATGKSAYKAWVGSCTWLNGLYWVNIVERRPDKLLTVENLGEVGKIKVPTEKHPLEPDLLYPLLRGRDVNRWRAKPSAHIILAQDPDTRTGHLESWMKEHLPETFRYFKQFEKLLRKRSGYRKYFNPKKDAFYSMYNVGPYTLSELKVCWAREDVLLRAAVCGSGVGPANAKKPVVPDQTVMFVPVMNLTEAHYLCAALNSAPSVFVPRAYTTDITLHILSVIGIPKFDSENAVHAKLAEFSQRAHELAARIAEDPQDEDAKRELAEVEDQIDHAAAELWGITESELQEIHQALEILS